MSPVTAIFIFSMCGTLLTSPEQTNRTKIGNLERGSVYDQGDERRTGALVPSGSLTVTGGAADAREMTTTNGLLGLLLAMNATLCLPTQENLQHDPISLEKGSVGQRVAALKEILKLKPSERPSGWVDAVKREATRMLEYRRRSRPRGDSDSEPDEVVEYFVGLVVAMNESHDPSVIPLLIKYCGVSSWAEDGLVAFGNRAVQAMLQAEKSRDNEFSQKGGVTIALERMLREPPSTTTFPLSDHSRQQIEAFSEGLLDTRRKLKSNELVDLSKLALATGRPDLRKEVIRLVNDPHAWKIHGIVDSYSIGFGQRLLRAALTKYPEIP